MAEEEVDWGMDDTQDVDEWRQGGAEEVEVGVDEDVISLDGMDDTEDATKSLQARSTSPRKASQSKSAPTGPSKAPPTGPRRVLKRPAGPNGAPTGPRSASVDGASAKPEQQDPAQDGPISPSAPPKEESPLPEGWVKFDSATHNRPFYYHKATQKTLWKRPEAPVEQERPLSPPVSPDVVPSPAIVQKAEEPLLKISEPVDPLKTKAEPVMIQADTVVDQADAVGKKVEQVDRKVPTGPSAGAATDLVASAYAARRAKVIEAPRSAAPKGPSSGRRDNGDSYRPRHSRSPSPRNEQAKRFRSDEGRRSPPLSARYSANDRTAPRSPPRHTFTIATRSPPRSIPPPGLRSVSGPEDARPRSPSRHRPNDLPTIASRGPELSRLPFERPLSRMPPRSPPRVPVDLPQRYAQGANTASIPQRRWGAQESAQDRTNLPVLQPPASASSISASRPAPSVDRPDPDDPAVRRARLREEQARMEDSLRKLKEEDAKLEKEVADRKQRDQEDMRIREDDLRRKEALERQAAERASARRQEENSRPPQNMYPARPPRDRPMPFDDPPRDASRRPPFPPVQRGDEYRPNSPPPGMKPPLSARFDRRPSPPRRMRLESPPRPSRHPTPGGFGASPPRRNGDSYQPSFDTVWVERTDRAPPPRALIDRLPPRESSDRPPREMMDRLPPPRDIVDRAPPRDMIDRPPPRDLVERIRPREDDRPRAQYAEPMSAFARSRTPRSPPPYSRQGSGRSERPFPQERPLAERMSLDADRPPRDDMRRRDDRGGGDGRSRRV